MKRFAWLGGIAVLVIVLAASGYAWRRHYVRSPEYSLEQVRQAIAERSTLRFERFVDVNTLATTAIDEVLAQATLQGVTSSTSGFGVIGTLLGAQAFDKVKPALTQELRAALLHAVEAGRLDSAFAKPPEDSTGRKLDLALLARNTTSDQMRLVGIGKIEQDQDLADLPLRFRNDLLDSTLVLKLRMKRTGDHWTITRPDNLTSFLDEIKDLQEKRLAEENLKIRNQIAKTVRLGPVRRDVTTLNWDDYVLFYVSVRNTGASPIDSVTLRLYHNGELVDSRYNYVFHTADIQPGQSVDAQGILKYNQFIDEDRTLRYSALKPLVWLVGVARPGGKHETIGEYISWSDFLQRRPK